MRSQYHERMGIEVDFPFYDRDGNLIDLETYARLSADGDYRLVQQDDVLTADGRTMWVSTVWLGVDHSHGLTGGLLIFETMVFVEGMNCEYCLRYSTAQEAHAGHEEVLRLLRSGVRVDELHGALHH